MQKQLLLQRRSRLRPQLRPAFSTGGAAGDAFSRRFFSWCRWL